MTRLRHGDVVEVIGPGDNTFPLCAIGLTGRVVALITKETGATPEDPLYQVRFNPQQPMRVDLEEGTDDEGGRYAFWREEEQQYAFWREEVQFVAPAPAPLRWLFALRAALVAAWWRARWWLRWLRRLAPRAAAGCIALLLSGCMALLPIVPRSPLRAAEPPTPDPTCVGYDHAQLGWGVTAAASGSLAASGGAMITVNSSDTFRYSMGGAIAGLAAFGVVGGFMMGYYVRKLAATCVQAKP